jgi:hypothetical protein
MVVFGVAYARAAPKVLDCHIEEGAPNGSADTQVMVDEDKKIIVYNYQFLKNGNEKNGRYIVEFNSVDGKKSEYDASMKIVIDNNDFIEASSADGSLIITKKDARLVYAFVTPVQGSDGGWTAYGNVHWDRCSTSPF